MAKILIVEDDAFITEKLNTLLKEEGFHVDTVASKKEALMQLEMHKYDLILLDLMLPDGSGYSLCTAIKHNTETPAVILTAMNDETSIVTGFDLGADDYIVKPFKPMELISRVKNVLRRCGRTPAMFEMDDLKIDTLKATAWKKGVEISLSALEYRLLLVFLNHRGEVMSRSRLLEEIWDVAGDFVNDNTLTVYIKRLRDKIETDPSDPQLLRTIRGLGYRLGN